MANDWLERIEETNNIVYDDIISLDIILDGDSISHVGIRERDIIAYGCRTKIGSIGGVATKEEYRNHGLATRLMESSIRRIDEDEGDVMFVSGGRGLYRRLGCVDAGEVFELVINCSESASFKEPKIELSLCKKNDIVKLVSAYQKEPVRFYRPMENFKLNLQRRPVPLWIVPDVLLMEKTGEFMGYLVIQESKKKAGREPGHGYISEYAGNRQAVVSALPALFERYDFSDLTLWAPRYDTELIQLFSKLGIRARRRNLMGHTFKLTNLPRLMKRFRPYIEERVGKEIADSLEVTQVDDNFSFKLEDEEFSSDGVSAVLIVFGSYDDREKEFMPKNGKLAEALEAIFPLPFIWPGLDSF